MSRKIAALAAAVSAAGLLAAVTLTPVATALIPDQDTTSPMLDALARDLRITHEEARARLDRESKAAEGFLRTSLGTTFAGGVPLGWRHLIGWHPDGPAADLSNQLIKLAGVAYLDSIARSPRYTTWLADNPQYGVKSPQLG